MGFGIPELDAEDQRLHALLRALNLAIGDGGDVEEIQRLMQQIELDALKHFEHEERLLEECAYPSRLGHAALHLQIKAEMEHAKKELRNIQVRQMWVDYGLLLTQLFVEHMRHETLKYRSFLHANLRPGPQGI